MDEPEVLDALKDLVEGRISSKSWLNWWSIHESDVRKVVSAGQFLRLKPRVRSHGDAVVVERCQKEATAILKSRNIAFTECCREEFTRGRELLDARTNFGGNVITVAEDRFCASVPRHVVDQWYQEFLVSGEANAEEWIITRMRTLIRYVSKPPNWINEPEWPWRGSFPLVFVGQINIPENSISTEAMISGVRLYVFSDRILNGNSAQVSYTLVKQQEL